MGFKDPFSGIAFTMHLYGAVGQKERKYSTLKRANAVLLLVLFLFIQVLKLLHTHHAEEFEAEDAKKEWVADKHCAICDYPFSASLLIENGGYLQLLGNIRLFYLVFYQSIHAISTGLSYSDRGPPATA